MSDTDLDRIKSDKLADNETANVIFAIAAGFFVGLVWVGAKMAEDLAPPRLRTLFVAADVKPDNVVEFLAETRISRDASRQEPGCRKYDIYQAHASSNQFILHEIYDRDGGERAHRRTQHYGTWRARVVLVFLVLVLVV